MKEIKKNDSDMWGKTPSLKPEAMQFNSYMCNTGDKAQAFGRKIMSDFDKRAFPVK